MEKNIDKNKQYWNRIASISFILAVMVIIRHNSSFANYEGGISDSLLRLYNGFKYSVTEIAVPMFFFIAGFNFFHGFNLKSCKDKLQRRVKSLFIPYVAWNTIYCAFALVTSNTFISQYFIGREKYDLSLWNIIKGCLYHSNCNPHFWFVFNLMLFAAISPIAYRLIEKKWLGAITVFVCTVCIICLGFTLPGEMIYRTDSIVYYSIGGYFGLHYYNIIAGNDCNRIVSFFKRHKGLSLACGICLVLSTGMLLIPDIGATLGFVIRMFGIIGLWMISGLWKDCISSWIPSGGAVFLMYAVHGIIQPIVVKLLYNMLPKQGWVVLINFVFSVTLCVFLCVLLKKFMSKYVKPIDRILCGWRK